ncbi:hypothetical protein SUGI_1192420 [Cryptomeria japonica]|uniref:uncharacterized protein LOC131063101 n=1 Tax=Cryptomeria japonica TaxID=3369 RepID=UPI002414A775|nr:uncharacterized protein LOC131063101 [Cryptomeria japonica]GLJ55526.1 hypothetical protein SUGI_1192420 [Cryptomeria japonica]
MGNCMWTSFGSAEAPGRMLSVISRGDNTYDPFQYAQSFPVDVQLENVAPCRLSSGSAADLLAKISNKEPTVEVVPSQQKGIWKVKLVISVEQLHDILSHQSNTEALIERMRLTASASASASASSPSTQNQRRVSFSSACYWKPSLESISEDTTFDNGIRTAITGK